MRLFPLALVLGLLAACAPEGDGGGSIGPRTIVEALMDEQIIPDHAAFADAAQRHEEAVEAFCDTPDTAALQAVYDGFGTMVIAWSRIEWLSFGPARQDNRRETLFFWPDSRNRGLRQAQDLAASDDVSQFEADSFADKSVAVKGLLAMEHILYGEGSDTLMTEGAVRCLYARAAAGSIAATAQALAAAWQGEDGYRTVLLEAGPDNPAYRNHREALQRLLTAASEQIQIVRDLKLAPLLRERNGEFTPIPPPFSDSGLALEAITANVESASNVFLTHATRLLPEDSAYRADSLRFEIDTVVQVLGELDSAGLSIDALARDDDTRKQLDYVLIPLDSAHELMSQTYPAALGLIMGFNSLDGD